MKILLLSVLVAVSCVFYVEGGITECWESCANELNFLKKAECLNKCSAAHYQDKPNRIAGGRQTVKIVEIPHQVSLILITRNEFICSASLISNWYLLTAAQCIYKKENLIPEIRIFSGNENWKERIGRGYAVETFYPHPDYTGKVTNSVFKEHDIGIVKSAVAFIFNNYQNKIKLRSQDIQTGLDVWVSGWGFVNQSPEQMTERLRKSSTKIISNTDCRNRYHYPVKNTQFCTIRIESKAEVCGGDIGGPVTYNKDLVGLVSYNFPCARALPDINTNVFAYRDFIKPFLEKRHLS